MKNKRYDEKGSFVEDLSEKEQLEAMRTWWSENGNYVLGGIVIGIVIIFGVSQYRRTTAEAEIAASTLYEDVMFAAATGKIDAAEEAAAELYRDYNKSDYAAQARLALARLYMDSARDQDAADVLTGLIESNPDRELAMVGRLRLAKILLYQGKAEEVVALIQDQPESAFSARLKEVLGDAYVALKRYPEAETAYIAALNDNPLARTVDTNLIQLKINDLPAVSNQGDADNSEAAQSETPAGDDAEALPADEAAVDQASSEEPTDEGTAQGETGNE
jgi:predicted negative regulator of RcsB-dependent stress response